MSIEFGAVCSWHPQPKVVGRAVELLMNSALDSSAPVTCAESAHGVTFTFGSAASAFMTVHDPGDHECADSWFVICKPHFREPLAWLLALVTAAATAELYSGRFVDEAGLLSTQRTARELLVRALRTRGTRAEDIMAELGHPFPP
jgi:hypothetical protein